MPQAEELSPVKRLMRTGAPSMERWTGEAFMWMETRFLGTFGPVDVATQMLNAGYQENASLVCVARLDQFDGTAVVGTIGTETLSTMSPTDAGWPGLKAQIFYLGKRYRVQSSGNDGVFVRLVLAEVVE